MRVLVLLAVLSLLLHAVLASADTNVSGTISSNTSWHVGDSPYIVVGSVTISSGVTLTIHPGVTVKFDGVYSLVVNGTLDATGKEDSIIVFTSNEADPAAGDWFNIRFSDSSDDANCIIKHATIRYAATGVRITDASPTIENVLIADGYDYGIDIDGGSPLIRDCIIRNIDGSLSLGFAFNIWYDSSPTITGCIIFNNDEGIRLFGTPASYPDPTIYDNLIFENNPNVAALAGGDASGLTISAENNWWGVTDSTQIAATILDNNDFGYSFSPTVDFVPFLTSAPGLAVYDIAASPALFSPNDDDQLDSTVVSATLTLTSDWTLRFRNSSDTVVRTYTGSGSSINQTWDGLDSGSAVVPDGDYTFDIEAENTDSSFVYMTQGYTVVVDTTAPTVAITDPADEDSVSGVVTVTGTADDTHFDSYTLEAGEGASPTGWEVITTSGVGITAGTLGSWSVRDSINGTYVLRLRASDTAGNSSVVQNEVLVDNIQITNLSAAPAFFAPNDTFTTINYTLDRDADVTVRVWALSFDPPDLFQAFFPDTSLVATPADSVAKLSGANSTTWDGRDDQSALLPFQSYVFTVDATTGNREGYYGPEYVVGTSQFNAVFGDSFVTTEYDPYKSEPVAITYSILLPSWVNIKIVKSADPATILRDLVSWEERDLGEHVDLWDGRNNSDSLVTVQSKVVAYGQLLPDNALVTEPRSVAITALDCSPYLIRPVYHEVTNISYTISVDATVSVKIYDPGGVLFVTLEDETAQSAGDYSIEWDGTNASGLRAVAEGSYRAQVISTGVDGNVVVRTGSVMIYQ